MERQIALRRSEPLRELYEEVAAYPVPERGPAAGRHEPAEPVPYFALPMRIEHEGRTLSFISSISTFNTPMDVTVAELAIETFLPADPATVKYLHSLLLLTGRVDGPRTGVRRPGTRATTIPPPGYRSITRR